MNSAANDVDAMSVKELKALITKAGLSHADCFEKSDLRQRAREALAKTAAAEEEESEEDEIEDSDDDAGSAALPAVRCAWARRCRLPRLVPATLVSRPWGSGSGSALEKSTALQCPGSISHAAAARQPPQRCAPSS